MRARWVKDVPIDGSLGHTVIQSWWPWRFQLVMTIFVDLTESNRILGTKEPSYYVTAVFPCDVTGGRTPKEPRYERRYSDPEVAAAGHREIVAILAAGHRLRSVTRIRRAGASAEGETPVETRTTTRGTRNV